MRNYYILFESHEQAVRLHGEFRAAGIRTAISPTPRAVTVCCGVSLLVEEAEIGKVRDYLASHTCTYKSVESIEQEFNAHRDRYI
jgi:hypothetical protein